MFFQETMTHSLLVFLWNFHSSGNPRASLPFYLSSLNEEKLQQFLKFNTKVFCLSSIILLRNWQGKKFPCDAVVKMLAILYFSRHDAIK